MPDPLPALRAAFDHLIETVSSPRQELILRQALLSVLTDAAAPAGPSRDSRTAARRQEEWNLLRSRIRAELGARGANLRDLGRETGLALSTLEHCLSPKGAAPGPSITGNLTRWLDDLPAPTEAPAGPSPSSPSSVETPTNGHDDAESLLANRLSESEAGRLGLYLTHARSQDVRAELGMTLECAQAVADGKDVAAKVIDRVRGFLAVDTSEGDRRHA